MNGQRGAVLVETALTITIVLTVIYGALQIGIIGLEQFRADGAAYTSSHAQGLNLSQPTPSAADPVAKAVGIYPGVSTGNVSLAKGQPPTTAETVNYDFTSTNARHGGISMVLPLQVVGTVVRNNVGNVVLGTTGSLFTLSGTSIDPAYEEVGAHADIQGNAFNSLGAFNDAASYFTEGENTPPYFVGFHYITFCSDTSSWTSCPTSDQEFDAVGLAEYLDVDNWGRGTNGSAPGAVFQATLGHQNTFAQLSSVIGSATTAQQLYTTGALRWNSGVLACMLNNWDSQQPGGYPNNYTAVGQYPLHPDVRCNVGS